MSTASENVRLHFQLAIRPARHRVHAPAGWFIAGEDASAWLSEMARWNVSLLDARLFFIPKSARDLRPCGVLVLLKGGAKPSPVAALPYARLGERLYFPADAQLDPDISLEEARALKWNVQVLHPGAGLVGFSEQDALGVEALLAPPPRRPGDWSRAEAGVAPRPPLTSVKADAVASLAQILEAGRGDIGSQTNEALPPAPDEAPLRDALKHSIQTGMFAVMGGLVALLSIGSAASSAARRNSAAGAGSSAGAGEEAGAAAAGKPAKAPGRLRRWAASKLGGINQTLEARRNRQLNRLLKLMKSDPDAGLQFALPMSDVAARGTAPPGGSLMRRSVAFNLASLFGSSLAMDRWGMSGDMLQQLRERYREAANRELKLARFSRAAYIFAHLLGDYALAADALKRGRLFRESAVIYGKKLNDRKAAAECLASGGLLNEAIEIYQELNRHEDAAALYERLGQFDEARTCYRKALAQLQEKGDLVAAARLLETKLEASDEALALLASAWPGNAGAGNCLWEWFSMCGRLGFHELATDRIGALIGAQLSEAQTHDDRGLLLVQKLTDVAVTYPNPVARARAADAARELSGYRLANADPRERQELVKAVTSLVRADKLLARDGNRYLEPLLAKPAPMPIPLKGKPPTLARSFRLPGNGEWSAVAAIARGFLAVGSPVAQVHSFVRGTWNGRLQQARVASLMTGRINVLLVPGQARTALMAQISHAERLVLDPVRLAGMDLFQDELTIQTPSYVDQTCVGVCREENGNTWVLRLNAASEVTLSAHAADETLIASYSLPLRLDRPARPVPMVARRGVVFIACGDTLVRFSGDASRLGHLHWPPQGPIRRLTASPPFKVTRLVASFGTGCAILKDFEQIQMLAHDLDDPLATFTPDGSLIVVGGRTGHVYGRGNKEFELLSKFQVQHPPIALLPAPNGEVAIFSAAGEVDIFHLA